MHLIYLVGHRSRVRVFLVWVWSFLTYARGARLIPSAAEAKRLAEAAAPVEGPPTRIESPPPQLEWH